MPNDARPARWKALEAKALAFALSLPETSEHHPWGETVAKVRNKVFVFLGIDARRPEVVLGMSVKLPETSLAILNEEYATPTGYGLGKSGWVTLAYRRADRVTIAELRELIHESYCAVAPKTLANHVADLLG